MRLTRHLADWLGKNVALARVENDVRIAHGADRVLGPDLTCLVIWKDKDSESRRRGSIATAVNKHPPRSRC